MTEKFEPIELPFKVDNEGADAALAHTEAGARKVGLAAKALAHEFGLTGAIARMFGSEVADVALSLGSCTSILGGVAVAAVAGYKVFEHFAEAAKKKDAIDASVASLEGEVDALYRNAGQNEAVTKATYNLLEAKRQLLMLDLEDKIQNETEALQKQMEDLENMATSSSGGPQYGSEFEEYTIEDDPELVREKQKAARKLEIHQQLYAQQIALLQKYNQSVEYENYSGDEKINKKLEQERMERMAAWGGMLDRMRQKSVDAELAAAAEEEKNRAANVSSWEAMLDNMRTKSAYANEYIVRMDEQKNEMIWKGAAMMASNVTNGLKMMYEQGGSHARTYFTLYKAAAISEAVITGTKAVLNSFEFGTKWGGPILGGTMAAAALGFTLAQINAIRSQQFNAGGGAAPTFSANSATGLPSVSSPDSSSINLTLVIDGQRQNIGLITEGVVKELDRNNGTVAGISIMMERSA